MENKNLPEVAAEAAVNNAVAEAAASVETAKAATLLEVALNTEKGGRKEQCKLFGRHFSSTTKVEVIKKGAEATLQVLATWQRNLEALLQEIEAKKSADFLAEVAASAANMPAEELQKAIAALQAVANKAV